MEQIKYGIIHAHTEHSLKDSVLSPQTLCKRAAELGAPAVVLTDHGVLTGVFEFMKAAAANGIKGIPGVEAYVQEDNSLTKREHLLLIPKNLLGYQAISKAVTMSNTRIHDKHPCVNIDILEQCFGVGSKGHGNVISTSACVGGILSKVLLKNRSLEAEAEKIRNKMKKCNSPEDPAYIANKKECDRLICEIKDTMTKRDALVKIASRKFKQKERSLNALPVGSAEYAEFKAKLDAEKSETENAAKELLAIKKRIAELNNLKKIVHAQCSEAEKTHSRWKINREALDKVLKGMKPDYELYEEAKAKALKYSDIFGENNFYIELQYHRISDEMYVMPLLVQIADELNLPVVACNDIHYANNSKEDVRARQLINSLRFNTWSPLREGDTEYYIKTDEELREILSEILPSETVEKALQGIGEIVSRCDVQLPKEKHYPKFVDEKGESAKYRLRRLAKEGISKRYKANEWTEEHEKRMEYELEIIEEQGYSDYLCIVEDFLSYARARGKDNPEKVGLSVGPGRGSAVGSLVCYLSGITGIDPMKYGLIFERFLNRERVSMPDIDSDFDIDIRGEVLEYVQNKYGKDAVCNILAMGTLAAKAAIRNVARVTGDERRGDTSAFMDIGDAIAKAIPKTPDIQLSDVEEELRDKFKDNEEALHIIDDAKLIEGAALQYSTHAAGVVISDNGDVSEYIPLMQNDDGLIMCQCNMVEAEENAGLLKMDFLGLRNLNIISAALRDIKRNYGISLDMEKVGQSLTNGISTPFDKKGNVFSDIFCKGKTNGVFQFESHGMKSMLKRFKPSNIEDLILLVAAYRPGPMQYLDDIVAVKHHKKKPEYVIPEMESVLGATYGSPIYQEQIMEIFHKFAGFTLGEADIIRRYMSKKKVEKFAAYKDKFIDGLIERGAEPQKAEDFWDQLLQFSKYAFNKSHACAYAIVAFYTAWLKLNYSVEYMTALLNYAKSDSKQTKQEKIAAIVNECKNMGIAVLPPDINNSGYDFKNRNGDIIFGLGSIKGIKSAANTIIETRNAERFHSFKDFVTRTPINKTVIEGCIYSGALDCWGQNRVAMQVVFRKSLIHTLRKKKLKVSYISSKVSCLSTKRKLDGQLEIVMMKFLITSYCGNSCKKRSLRKMISRNSVN